MRLWHASLGRISVRGLHVLTSPPAYYVNKLFEVINPEAFRSSRVLAPGPDAGLPSPHFDKRPVPQTTTRRNHHGWLRRIRSAAGDRFRENG